jgi:hypothetical protein
MFMHDMEINTYMMINYYYYYGAFTLDVKSVLDEKSRWHPRWHLMLNGQ